MPVLITSMFDKEPIKNERASLETPFSHYMSMRNILDAQGSGPIWPKFELVRDFRPGLVTCKFEKDLIKYNREKVETSFSPFSQWALSVAMETRVLIQSALKPYAAFPHPSDTTHKIW